MKAYSYNLLVEDIFDVNNVEVEYMRKIEDAIHCVASRSPLSDQSLSFRKTWTGFYRGSVHFYIPLHKLG